MESSRNLASAACAVTVFSHRGLSGTSTDSTVPNEAQLLSIVDRGINAFDLDLVFASDAPIGEIVVAHPVSLQNKLGEADIFETRSSLLRNQNLLLVDKLLKMVAQRNLTVALDLKGHQQKPAKHAEQLLWLARRVQRMNLYNRVWLWTDTTDSARTLRRSLRKLDAKEPPLKLLKAVRDWGLTPSANGKFDCSGPQRLQRADASLYAFLGPSFKCANRQLLSPSWVKWTPAELLVWVVDTDAELHAMLRVGVRNVISNTPLRVRAAASRLCGR